MDNKENKRIFTKETKKNFIIFLLILFILLLLIALFYLFNIKNNFKSKKIITSSVLQNDNIDISTTTSNIFNVSSNQTIMTQDLELNGNKLNLVFVETLNNDKNISIVELYINNNNIGYFENATKESNNNVIKKILGEDNKEYLFISIPSINNNIIKEKPLIINDKLNKIYEFDEFNFYGQTVFYLNSDKNIRNYSINSNNIIYYSKLSIIQIENYSYYEYANANKLTINNSVVKVNNVGIVKGSFDGPGFYK